MYLVLYKMYKFIIFFFYKWIIFFGRNCFLFMLVDMVNIINVGIKKKRCNKYELIMYYWNFWDNGYLKKKSLLLYFDNKINKIFLYYI